MKGQSEPIADEYNEDTDKANDSDDDQWDGDNKLVIDLESNNQSTENAANAAATSTTSTKSSALADAVATTDNMTENKIPPQTPATVASAQLSPTMQPDANTMAATTKPKGKRGGRKASDNSKNDQSKEEAGGSAAAPGVRANSKQTRADKQQQAKEKPAANKPGRKKREKSAAAAVNNSKQQLHSDSKSSAKVPEEQQSSAASSTLVQQVAASVKAEGIASTTTGKHSATKIKAEPVQSKDASTDYDYRSVGLLTEPENLGPCEPGTHVCLEGIVWQETNNGVLVVNVTWRGKTYMGTLLDATKHDWSPPSCESPIGDFEGRTPKGRSKRSRVPLSDTFKDINERKLRKEMRRQTGANNQPSSPAKSDTSKRKSKNIDADSNEPTSKRSRAASRNGRSVTPVSPPGLLECPEPNCGKKYKQLNGLKYHQRNAHADTTNNYDSNSDPEKSESIPSPEEPKKLSRRGKGERQTKAEKRSEWREEDDSCSNMTEPDFPSKNHVTSVSSTTSQHDSTTLVNSVNTTSVITSCTSNLATYTSQSISNAQPSSLHNSPAVTHQASSIAGSHVTSVSSTSTQSSLAPSTSVPVAAITPQVMKPMDSTALPPTNTTRSLTTTPKILPKSSSNSMAPISTITSQGSFNPALKPIQPKPTILGEATPNPSFNELRDQKKLKRRRSMSRDDLTSNSPLSSDQLRRMEMDTARSQNSAESAMQLQSPSYSDISEDGDSLRNLTAKRELLNNYPVPTMPNNSNSLVATVSPQKNLPPLEKDTTVSKSSSINSSSSEEMRRMADRKHHKDDIMMTKQPFTSTWSKTSSLPSSREVDNKASSERYQFLKENKDMNPAIPMHVQAFNEAMAASREFQTHLAHQRSGPTPEELKLLQYHHEARLHQEKNDMKRESGGLSHSPANKMAVKPPMDSAADLSRSIARSSPMMHPSNMALLNANPFLALASMQAAGLPNMPNSMLSRFSPFAMPTENKDPKSNHLPPHMMGKSDHKIHELDAKSPRPSSTNERGHSASSSKSQQQAAAAAAAMSAASFMQPPHPSLLGLHPGYGFHNLK